MEGGPYGARPGPVGARASAGPLPVAPAGLPPDVPARSPVLSAGRVYQSGGRALKKVETFLAPSYQGVMCSV